MNATLINLSQLSPHVAHFYIFMSVPIHSNTSQKILTAYIFRSVHARLASSHLAPGQHLTDKWSVPRAVSVASRCLMCYWSMHKYLNFFRVEQLKIWKNWAGSIFWLYVSTLLSHGISYCRNHCIWVFKFSALSLKA